MHVISWIRNFFYSPHIYKAQYMAKGLFPSPNIFSCLLSTQACAHSKCQNPNLFINPPALNPLPTRPSPFPVTQQYFLVYKRLSLLSIPPPLSSPPLSSHTSNKHTTLKFLIILPPSQTFSNNHPTHSTIRPHLRRDNIVYTRDTAWYCQKIPWVLGSRSRIFRKLSWLIHMPGLGWIGVGSVGMDIE
jgi:hypothetical protein